MWAAEGDTHDFAQTLQQLLNNNASIDDITIDAQSYPIKKVIVSYRYNKTLTNAVTVEVSVGGTSWGSSNVVGTGSNYTTMEFTGTEATGEVFISFTNNTGNGTGHGTLYVNNVTLTEGNSADPGKTDVTLSFAEDSYEADYNGGVGTFSAPTLTKSADVAVSYTSTDESVATVNETSGAITLKGKGTTTIRASFAGDATYNSASAAYELTVVDNKRYTVSEAFTIIDSGTATQKAGVYVRGVISKIDNVNTSTGKATYWISSNGSTSGQQLEAYNGKYINNVGFTSADQITVGDRVVIYGNLTKYGSTYEFAADNYLISVTPDTRTAVNMSTFTATETDLTVGDIQATSVTNDQAGWAAAYTYSSDDESIATIAADGKITAVAKGTTKVWAILNVDDEDDDYKVGTTDRKSIDITVHNPSHTAQFSINGVIDNGNDDTVEEGEAISFPTAPASIGGKSFVGWTSAAIDGMQDDVPTVLVNSANMSTSNITYYAVFASSSTGTVTKTDVINSDVTGITGNNYYGWSGLQAENGSAAVYAGQCAGSNNTIQLRTNNSNSGIITTTSGGKVKKVVIDWYSGTAKGRTLNIYGNNSAYSFENTGTDVTVSELYNNSKQGTLLGSIVKETSTELTITGDYTYIGIRSADGALYCNSISIDWETTGTVYSAYCTSIPSSVPVTISAAGLATFASDVALDFTGVTDLEAYIAKEESGAIKLHQVNKVPAGTGVLLRAKNNATDFEVPVATTNDDVTDNIFVRGTGAAVASSEGGKYNYVLGKHNGEVGFYLAGGMTVATNKAYLQTTIASARIAFDFDTEDVTAIEAVKAQNVESSQFFNLAGQRVAQPTKGLYIVNGKKVVIK